MLSLDLKKAFDKIEHAQLFDALRSQGVTEPYLALLHDLYADQMGTANGSRGFKIMRGAKQGDVLSSLLFNAAWESVCIPKMETEVAESRLGVGKLL